MVAGLVQFLGTVNLLAYFSADLYFAFALSRLKADHPDIDEAAERSRGGGGTTSSSSSNNRGYSNLEEGDTRSGGGMGLGGTSNANSDPITIVLRAAKDGHGSLTGEFSGLFSTIRGRMSGHEPLDGQDHSQAKHQLIHLAVIVASFGIPIFGLLQVFFPNSLMSWSMFDVPNWIGILTMVPALMIVIVYCARAVRVSSFSSVTKTQWLSMTWFRLDVTCLMAALFLVGWGDWFLALLWGIVAGYLAYCLLATERTLQSMVSNTQLMRDEVGGGNHPGGGITAGGGFSQGSGLLRETMNSHIPNHQTQPQYQEIGGNASAGASYGAAPTDVERRQSKGDKRSSSSTKKDKKAKKAASTATASRTASGSNDDSDEEAVEMATR
jgi:uncharacterized membrane protein YgcG